MVSDGEYADRGSWRGGNTEHSLLDSGMSHASAHDKAESAEHSFLD